MANERKHRTHKKNGAGREAWEQRKRDRNAARPQQLTSQEFDAEGKVTKVIRVR